MTSHKTYQKIWYESHKEQEKERMRLWRIKNKKKIRQYRKQYNTKNKAEINRKKKIYRHNNLDKIKAYRQRPKVKERARVHVANYRKNNPDKIKIYNEKSKEKRKIWLKEYRQRPEVKERINRLERIRRKTNPRSNRRATIELQIAMNNVRLRDNQRCQWLNCKKTFRDAPIHVHHIFPKNEYPEFELVESYMICYCANHHGLFHRYRGDHYSEMITARYQESVLVKGRD